MSKICHVYDSEFMQDEGGLEGLHLWCMDTESKPVHIIIKNSPIYMYIELPETPVISSWDSDSVDLLYENFKKVHGKCAPFMMEFTERETLYYYKNGQTVPMARLFFKSPRDMFICSSRLSKNKEYPDFGSMIFRVYENKISVRRKIFTIRKTRYSQWFRFIGKEIPFDHPERQAVKGAPGREIQEYIIYDYNNIIPIDPSESTKWTTRPRTLSFDIETYSDNHHALPDKNNPDHVVYMISCLYQVTGDRSTRKKYVILTEDCHDIPDVQVIKVDNEEDLILAFLELIELLDPEILMGYNIYGYDFPYIDARFSMRRESYEPCSRLQGYIPEFVHMEWASGAYGTTNIHYLKMPGRISIDLLPVIKRDYKFAKYTLDFVSGELLGSSKHDVSHLDMFRAYESKDCDEMTRVTKYCVQDSDLVIDLYEKMNLWIGLVEMSNIVGVEIMELFTRGQQIRCVSQIYDMTAKKKIVLNSREQIEIEYEGGFVGNPIPGIHENTFSLDFKSLYPSIMRAYNICYTTFVPQIYVDEYDPEDLNTIEIKPGVSFSFVKAHIRVGILPQLVANLVNERNLVRKEIKRLCALKSKVESEEERKQIELTMIVLDKRQLGLKVSANSMYGFLGVQNGGKLPLIEGAISITAKGRQLIQEVNRFMIEKYKATIVYGDTDSSMITVPAIKSREELTSFAGKIAQEISGIPEIRDSEGNVIQEAVAGLFPPPLEMEFENGMRFLGITKKKYAALLVDDHGAFKLDKDGLEKIYVRGIVLTRRDNFPYLRQQYTKVLRSILLKKPIEETFKIILDTVIEVLDEKLPARGNFTIIRGIGKEYANNNYFMKVFADELARMGHPAAAGDRLEYVIVEAPPKTPIGRKMRLIEMYEESQNYDESKEGPLPDNVYPKEKIDYMYYITNGLQNPIDQLFAAGYVDQLFKTTLSTSGYSPKNSAARPVMVQKPIKMMMTIIKDNMKKENYTLDECKEFLRSNIYSWFLKELEEAKPIDVDDDDIEISDSDSDDFV